MCFFVRFPFIEQQPPQITQSVEPQYNVFHVTREDDRALRCRHRGQNCVALQHAFKTNVSFSVWSLRVLTLRTSGHFHVSTTRLNHVAAVQHMTAAQVSLKHQTDVGQRLKQWTTKSDSKPTRTAWRNWVLCFFTYKILIYLNHPPWWTLCMEQLVISKRSIRAFFSDLHQWYAVVFCNFNHVLQIK